MVKPADLGLFVVAMIVNGGVLHALPDNRSRFAWAVGAVLVYTIGYRDAKKAGA